MLATPSHLATPTPPYHSCPNSIQSLSGGSLVVPSSAFAISHQIFPNSISYARVQPEACRSAHRHWLSDSYCEAVDNAVSSRCYCSAQALSLTISGPFRNGTDTRRQTGHALQPLTRPKTYQLETWLNKPETHEQAMMGEKTTRTFAKTMNFLEEMEKRVDGDTK